MFEGLLLTTSYVYRYGLSAGQDCGTRFRASWDFSVLMVWLIFIIIFSFCSQLLLDYDCVIKYTGNKVSYQLTAYNLSTKNLISAWPFVKVLTLYQYWLCHTHKTKLFENFRFTTLSILSLCAWSMDVNDLSLLKLCLMGSKLMSILHFPPLHLVHFGDIYCVYLQNWGICCFQVCKHSLILSVPL